MRRFQLIRISLAALTALTATAIACDLFADTPDAPYYLQQIKPLLTRKCVSCHGVLKQEGSLRLDTRDLMVRGGDSGAAAAPGDSAASELLSRVQADPYSRMPPEGEPLTPAEIDMLRRWIEAGAPAPADEAAQTSPDEHWAFQPLDDVHLPPRESVARGNVIDRLVRRRLREKGLQPAPPAPPLTLVRRMFLVMHGLPPTAQQAADWSQRLEQASSESARQRAIDDLIESLLASPRYGERWAQHWLDLVRYADTHGFEVNTPRENAWPYRDYVIQSFNDDLPFDRFITEQLAGDTLEQDAATGFLVAAAVLLPGQIGKDDASKRLARQDSLDEIVVGVSATFMGLSVGCARCHDHKFDPITQRDYYALQAVFAGVEYGDRPMSRSNSARAERAAEVRRQIAAIEHRLEQLELDAAQPPVLLADDEELSQVELLAVKNGHGANPAGKRRGYRDDPGGADRGPNLSQGRYTWWDNRPGQDVCAWKLPASPSPAPEDYRVWISWGVHGSGVHTRDARYVLDRDGDLATREDQTEIAQADQFYCAGQTSGPSEKQPRWSGFQNAGVHAFAPGAKLILRGGETGTGITADVIAIQRTHAGQRSDLLLRAPVSPSRNVERFSPIEAKHIRFTTLATIDNNRHQPCIDELEVFGPEAVEQNLALASRGVKPSSSGNYSETGKHQLKHINDGAYGNSRSWISNELGKGWVQLELPQARRVNKIVWGRDREEQFTDRLPTRYRIETSLDGQHWSTVASSADRLPLAAPYERAAHWLRRAAVVATGSHDGDGLAADVERLETLRKKQAELSRPQLVYAGKFREPDMIRRLRRGDPEQPLEVVPPGSPSRIAPERIRPATLPPSAPEAARRLALADWLTSEQNPLTARVIANRIWQHHFGSGLAAMPSDFGLRAPTPSHPWLLDALANYLIDRQWSLKELHRLILSSRTFQQGTRLDPRAAAVDRANRLLWRFAPRRLEGEAIRDSMLLASGELNLEMGGPGFNLFQTRGGLSGFPPVEKFTKNELRRMIYSHKIRMERVPVFGAFDCPDAGQPTPKRSRSTTAIQALNLFNSPFVYARAEALARRAEADAATAPSPRGAGIAAAFRHALGREPSTAEQERAEAVVQQHGLPTLCRVLLNLNEFLFIP